MRLLSAPSVTRRLWVAAAGVVLVAGLLPGQADAAPSHAAVGPGDTAHAAGQGEELANYDARRAGLAKASVAARRAASLAKAAPAAQVLQRKLGVQGIVDIDPVTGTPRRIARLDGFLTPKSKKSPVTIALNYIKAHADVMGLDADAVKRLTLRKHYKDIVGTHHLSFVQKVNGVPFFGNGLKAHVTKDGRLIQIDGSPVGQLPASAGRATLSAQKARAAAVRDVFGDSNATVRKTTADATRTTTFTDGGKAQLVLFQAARGPRLAWQTIVMDEGYLHVIDAADATVLYRRNLKSRYSHHSATTWDNYPGAAKGGKAVKRSLKKWLPKKAKKLSGNVAHVYADVNDDNVANPGEDVKPTKKRSFNFGFTNFTTAVGAPCAAAYRCSWNPAVANSWKKNRAQNAAQMFYFLATMHDHLAAAPIGFTRAAGNFEAKDGDAIQGHAMDGANTANGLPDASHVNNANMSTPPDGIPPTMQMYLFRTPGDPTDPFIAGNSGDTADILYHEYVHGLSNRLVIDAAGNSGLVGPHADAMGEAWSDWYAMDFLVAKGFEKDTAAHGELLLGKYVSAGANLIRTQPLDCPVGSTAKRCPGTPTAGPGGYTFGDFGRVLPGGPQVHADGEIWAQTLWDLRRAIGYKAAQSLITRAMELSPYNPSFLDQRNSILQADLVVNKGKLRGKIWKVFANRGMGYFAAATDGDDAAPVEDFSLPPAPGTPKGTLTGVVADSATGKPIPGVVVGFGGHVSSFTGGYSATTNAAGQYTITGILPGTYPKVNARGAGYEPQTQTVSVAARANTVNWTLRRDWAATSGGSAVVDFNGPDYSQYGCGPGNLFDLSQGAGWASDVTPAIGPMTPMRVVVKLPATIDVSGIAVNPATTCGLPGSSSTGDYRLETSTDGQKWTVASEGHFGVADRNMHAVQLNSGSTGAVQYVRYTMLSTQVADLGGSCPGPFGGCENVASTELAVYGSAH